MKVVVALKEVALVEDAFEIVDDRIDDAHLDYELNEWDEYALETAVQLGEEGLVDEVVTVTVGPERSEETIRKALAKGADRSIRVWDSSLEERAFLDSGAKSRILAGAVEREAPELVLTGVQSDDDMFGATGVALAARLGYAWAAVVNYLDLEADAEQISVHRELEGGIQEHTEVELPAVCTIQTGINEPRYASLRGIRMAQRAEIETYDLDALDLDASAIDGRVARTAIRKPVSEGTAEIYEGSAEETAGRLAAFLRDRGVDA